MNGVAGADLQWSGDGYAAISGDLLKWLQKLDQCFQAWAKTLGAEERRFPSLIALESLAPIAYLKSFPHLATLASCGVRDDLVLRTIAANTGDLGHDWLDAPRHLLTPAACYHFYHRLAGKPAESACVAFGLERWLFAMFETHGADIGLWPQPGSES